MADMYLVCPAATDVISWETFADAFSNNWPILTCKIATDVISWQLIGSTSSADAGLVCESTTDVIRWQQLS